MQPVLWFQLQKMTPVNQGTLSMPTLNCSKYKASYIATLYNSFNSALLYKAKPHFKMFPVT